MEKKNCQDDVKVVGLNKNKGLKSINKTTGKQHTIPP